MRVIHGMTAALIIIMIILVVSLQPLLRIQRVMAGETSIPSFVTKNKLVYESGFVYQWLDPHVAYYQYDYWTLWHSVETLLWYNKSSATDLIPWLAQNYTMVNETAYDFTLRHGITFQDGTAFNATAVWFSFNRLLIIDGTSGSGYHGSQAAWMVQQLVDPDGELFTAMGASPIYDASWVQSVLDLNFAEIVDDYTVRLHVKTPTSQLLAILSGTWAGIISPSETVTKDYQHGGWNFAAEQQPQYNYTKYFIHIAGNGDTYFNLPENGWTFGTGPYYVENVNPTTYKIVLKAYDNYWGGPNNMNLPPPGKQRIETIEFQYQPNFTTRLLDLKQGTATGIAVAAADIFSVVDKDTWINNSILDSIIPGVTVHGVIPTFNTWWLDFNTNVTNPNGAFKSWQPFADRRFRMAVACSVNMTCMNIYANNRLSVLADNIIPPGTFPEGSYNPDVKPIFSFNLTRAQELLLDAYEHPLNSSSYDMYYYNGTKIPPGLVDNKFGVDNPQVVEFYVQNGVTAFIQILTTMAENLNLIARAITGSSSALQFRVVIVPGGQQYTLAARHQIDAYMGGWIADYNHVIDWLMPMYYSRGTYPSWNRWNITTLDDLYQQAVEADSMGNFTALVEITNQMNTLANQLVMYMVWWHNTVYAVRSSWLQGWYLNPVYGVDIWSTMYFEDLAPPAIHILSPEENRAYNKTSITLAFTVSEPVSWIGYSLDGKANITITGNTTITDLSEGTHTLVVHANDTAGNLNASLPVAFKVDLTPPQIGPPIHTPEGLVDPSQEVTVSVNVTDSISEVESVFLSFTNNTLWHDIPMNYNMEKRMYEANILGQQPNVLVKYKIKAYDFAGNIAIDDNEGEYYVYAVTPEFPSAGILLLSLLFAVFTVILIKKIIVKKQLPENRLKSDFSLSTR